MNRSITIHFWIWFIVAVIWLVQGNLGAFVNALACCWFTICWWHAEREME